MKTFRFGIVGCGQIALRHAGCIAERGQLVAVCDIVPEKATAIAGLYKASAFSTIEEMLQESSVDVVAVCSPNGWHARHTIQALNAGCHVICEKPMAISSADCREMIAASRTNNRHLFIVKQNRFNPPVAAVKQLLSDGRLGNLYSIQVNCCWNRPAAYYNHSWHGTLDLDGGTLYTQFSHFIDLLYWLAGDVKGIQASMANYAHRESIQFEDTGAVLFEFSSGAIGSLHYTVNSYGQNMEGSFVVVAEKGTVKVGGQYMNELEYQSIENYRIENLAAGSPANHYGHYQGSMSNHHKVYDNVIAVLEGRADIATGMLEGLKTVEIIEQIYKTARRA